MPADIALTGQLTGISTIGGQLGPTLINYALDDAAQFTTREIPIAPNTVSQVVAIAAVGTQRLFYLKSDTDVTVQLNSEPAIALKGGGVVVRCGTPNVTSLTFTGNTLTPSVVFVVIVGT